ncbi:phosphatase PAP2 family protein [Streptomyces alfalfae]|uniref:diacylglycerol kinase family protein n=1 Tax=Streptomyces alfalfae TaxID=1642299 RepID=UPI0009A194C3|nr:diacylglycerol kinase family protein [Streptomyces alfalfae]AYA19921.1 phosphatase PAP2 family protein [Streptomyces fradiae]QUI30482.1 phosphatase PAP2 family protein [Streptomyces alfalfae]RXX44222.1 phosphatase PAP2 family protein [Streptomyces alfalfae]RZN02116.1 phosphatase PAP2 family protein [Streptomyces alfalfae]
MKDLLRHRARRLLGVDHRLLFCGVAAGMWVFGGVRGRRAAVRGLTSMGLASATVNTLSRSAVSRSRPVHEAAPLLRHLPRKPLTGPYPSGHTASAAAFAAGAALEAPGWGAALAPVAASVAYSRIHGGARDPRDVLVGAALGVGAAYAVRGMVPTRAQLPPPARPRVDAPALPEGDGLIVVVNPSSGAQPQLADPVRQIKTALPRAEVVLYEEEAGALPKVLEEAAREAARRGGVLGVCGGDGTVNAAVAPALRFDVPLMVLPGGTFNHFAADLGVDTIADACVAVGRGSAVRADVGRIKPLSGLGPGGRVHAEEAHFLNTFSLGSYPELVRSREHWSPKIGGPPATLLGVLQILRTGRPLRAVVNGRRRSMWLLFAGNGAYRSVGIAPVRRHDLADGLLDVRIAHAGRFARSRLLAAALAGQLTRTRVYAAAKPQRLVISGLPEGTHMAYDGEVTPAPPALLIDKLPEALTVYRPTAD